MNSFSNEQIPKFEFSIELTLIFVCLFVCLHTTMYSIFLPFFCILNFSKKKETNKIMTYVDRLRNRDFVARIFRIDMIIFIFLFTWWIIVVFSQKRKEVSNWLYYLNKCLFTSKEKKDRIDYKFFIYSSLREKIMSSSLFSRPTPTFGDSPGLHPTIDKCAQHIHFDDYLIFSKSRNKQKHSFGKTIGLIIALVSYFLALVLIIGDLFFDNQGRFIGFDHLKNSLTYSLSSFRKYSSLFSFTNTSIRTTKKMDRTIMDDSVWSTSMNKKSISIRSIKILFQGTMVILCNNNFMSSKWKRWW